MFVKFTYENADLYINYKFIAMVTVNKDCGEVLIYLSDGNCYCVDGAIDDILNDIKKAVDFNK